MYDTIKDIHGIAHDPHQEVQRLDDIRSFIDNLVRLSDVSATRKVWGVIFEALRTAHGVGYVNADKWNYMEEVLTDYFMEGGRDAETIEQDVVEAFHDDIKELEEAISQWEQENDTTVERATF